VTPNPDGLATSPSLCDPETKAQGFTGAPTPQGDGFDVDYVAHEIGHQFSMSHTFNNDIDGSCNTRSIDSAYEPASGVTIMGYGGICAPRNLAANSIEYFNLRSFDQALNYLQNTVPAQYPNCGGAPRPAIPRR
ncbi:MAG TPA: M12 family metallo-peptidase, partial [Pyrinomonadaceae bacterium]|nr:M12 family metallo-peptidase [Pyrinomonadaceae bacterium]